MVTELPVTMTTVPFWPTTAYGWCGVFGFIVMLIVAICGGLCCFRKWTLKHMCNKHQTQIRAIDRNNYVLIRIEVPEKAPVVIVQEERRPVSAVPLSQSSNYTDSDGVTWLD